MPLHYSRLSVWRSTWETQTTRNFVRINFRLAGPNARPGPAWDQRPRKVPHAKPAVQLELGYRIDHLTAILFAMVTVISTGIFLFSIGYMRDEAKGKLSITKFISITDICIVADDMADSSCICRCSAFQC